MGSCSSVGQSPDVCPVKVVGETKIAREPPGRCGTAISRVIAIRRRDVASHSVWTGTAFAVCAAAGIRPSTRQGYWASSGLEGCSGRGQRRRLPRRWTSIAQPDLPPGGPGRSFGIGLSVQTGSRFVGRKAAGDGAHLLDVWGEDLLWTFVDPIQRFEVAQDRFDG